MGVVPVLFSKISVQIFAFLAKKCYLCTRISEIEDHMGRILSIDYGRKRTGLAATDPLQIIANGITTVPTHELEKWLQDYIPREGVERVLVGLPRQMSGEMSESWQYIEPFLRRLRKLMPELPIELVDERFTSKMASLSIAQSGVGKQRRKEDKALIDEVSATIILQQWMENRTMPGYRPTMF